MGESGQTVSRVTPGRPRVECPRLGQLRLGQRETRLPLPRRTEEEKEEEVTMRPNWTAVQVTGGERGRGVRVREAWGREAWGRRISAT